MPKVTLKTLLDACDERKTDILARVEAMSEAARNARPAPGEWSPHEIIAHLVVTEELSVGQIEAAARPSGSVPLKPGVKGALFVALIAGPMRAGKRLPAPGIFAPDPLAGLPLPVLAERWNAARQAVRARIARVTPQTENDAVALHPYAGPLSPSQFLTIMDAHLTYHQKQLARRAVAKAV